MRRIIHLLFFLIFTFPINAQGNTITRSLIDNWSFKASNDSVWLKASVPGTIHTDLMANGIIEDPYYRLNERKIQWVDKKDWIYQTTFNLNNQEFNRQNHELNFKGLDTYANVYLNDSIILKSNNMHRTYIVNVKEYLCLNMS